VEIVVALVAVVLLLTLYAFWTARRLDRLHAKLDAAGYALDAQLRVRAGAAARFADLAPLPREAIVQLAQTAEVAAEAPGLGHDREMVENALSRALIAAEKSAPEPFTGSAVGSGLGDAATRASFARRFHNDAVRDVMMLRRRRIVRWLRLAGRASLPSYFEMVEPALPNSEVTTVTAPYD